MEAEDIWRCSFQNWYSDFKNVTIDSVVIPFPVGYKEYLLTDGVMIPCHDQVQIHHDSNSSNSSEDWSDDESVNSNEIEVPKFSEFDEEIKKAIISLGGKVFPKLNWSSPRDATWIALNNSPCCTSVSDIYLLLKSSDFVIHDLTKPFDHCIESDNYRELFSSCDVSYYLILRKWEEINPSREFRCFVKDNVLIALCPRDLSQFNDYNISHKSSIIKDILDFFTESIQDEFQSSDYVFDVVREKEGSVMLLDFGPFGEITDSLLFDWPELTSGKMMTGKNILPEYRFVSHNHGIQPSLLSHHAFPQDIIDITSGEDSFKFVDLLKLIEQKRNDTPLEED